MKNKTKTTSTVKNLTKFNVMHVVPISSNVLNAKLALQMATLKIKVVLTIAKLALIVNLKTDALMTLQDPFASEKSKEILKLYCLWLSVDVPTLIILNVVKTKLLNTKTHAICCAISISHLGVFVLGEVVTLQVKFVQKMIQQTITINKVITLKMNKKS